MHLTGNATIRSATTDDIEAVHAWLQQEKALGIPGNFLCNWNVILHHHGDGRVLVFVDPDTNKPIAFLAGGLTKDGILQVQHAFRGQGIGRALVEYVVDDCVAQARSILSIECAPPTSIPFWQKMGFTLIENNYAYRVLGMRHELPAEGKPIDVIIRFLPEQCAYGHESAPLASYSPIAVQTPDGDIHLNERVVFAKCTYQRDVVVELVVSGERLFLDKAKREEASDFGVSHDWDGYYIDRLHP